MPRAEVEVDRRMEIAADTMALLLLTLTGRSSHPTRSSPHQHTVPINRRCLTLRRSSGTPSTVSRTLLNHSTLRSCPKITIRTTPRSYISNSSNNRCHKGKVSNCPMRSSRMRRLLNPNTTSPTKHLRSSIRLLLSSGALIPPLSKATANTLREHEVDVVGTMTEEEQSRR